MNPYRDFPGRSLRPAHYDEISEERLTETVEMLQRVAKNTNATLNQVIDVYDAACRNRLTETLLDSGDAFDYMLNDIKNWKKSEGAIRVMLSGDYLADEMKVKIVSD